MARSGPIPIHHPTQNYSNAYYNQGFSHSPLNSPQSPFYHLDPRSPRTVFPMPAPMENPTPPIGRSSPQSSPAYHLDPRSPRTIFPMPAPMQNPTPPIGRSRNSYARPSAEQHLYKKMITEILEDVANGLDDDVWGFLTYMEYNHCVARTYITGKEFIVDNSDNPIDSTSLGLSSLPSHERDSKLQNIRHAVHKGIVLSSDEEGNIYLTNESKVPVIIKGSNEPEKCCLSEEALRLHGNIKPGNDCVVIFDMEEFRSQIGLQIVNGYNDEERLSYMSLVRLCLGETGPGLNSPCWILLVNLKALKMSISDEVRTDMENYVARLNVSSNQQVKKDLPSKRMKNEIKQEALRKTRIELRRQGERIKDHMKYSWNDVYFKNEDSSLNIETLKEGFVDPEIDYDDSEEDEVNTPHEEPQMQVDLQRLKTIVRNQRSTSVWTPMNSRPVKHWAKLSYKIKRYSGNEGAH